MSDRPLVSFRHVSKRFPGARALEDVSFDVRRGSCHALCGENGAGKSTLGKLLAGIEQPDAGEIAVDGRAVQLRGSARRAAAGIGMVHQELAFCENLSVAENLCLGDLPGAACSCRAARWSKRARALLAAIDAPIDVRRLVGELTVGRAADGADRRRGRQRRARDHLRRADEQPVPARDRALLRAARSAAARGVTCVFVSHRMQEIFRLCDTITVLRDGRHVATKPIGEIDEAALVQLMIGRRLEEYLPDDDDAWAAAARCCASTELSSPRKFADISFSVHAGEVVGHRRAGGRRAHRHRARDLRARSARRTGGSRSRASRSACARRRRRCAPASASSPRIASATAWC